MRVWLLRLNSFSALIRERAHRRYWSLHEASENSGNYINRFYSVVWGHFQFDGLSPARFETSRLTPDPERSIRSEVNLASMRVLLNLENG